MKKILLICLILLLGGCGVPASESGADGASGVNGEDGRGAITPLLRPYTWDTSNTVANFADIGTTDIQLSQVAMNQDNNNNYLLITIPANYAGKRIQCVINDVISSEVIVPDDGSYTLVFSTLYGVSTQWGVYLDCERLNPLSSINYFSWYIDGIVQESYYVDSFEGYVL